jgi:hypothetical protein
MFQSYCLVSLRLICSEKFNEVHNKVLGKSILIINSLANESISAELYSRSRWRPRQRE